jgi:RimJ/RimL family protein N-acetyltransferase
MNVQLASEQDIFQISQLYFDVYQGTYPDPLMKDFNLIRQFIKSESGYWFVTKDQNEIIASVLAAYDFDNKIAKAFGAVVRNEYRGQGIMEELLQYGIDFLRERTPGVDVIYSTTRTVNEAAQTLTEKLGFKKLGIFPNAHRTSDYETHCLAAIVYPSAIEKRHSNYKIHHELESLYSVVRKEVGMGIAELESIVPEKPSKELFAPGELEVVKSPRFVSYRYNFLKSEKKLEFEFFPFHQPNLVIMSPDQSIELFCHLSSVDGYCVIVGGKMPANQDFSQLFLQSNRLLRDAGARYIEVIVRADRPKILESILKAKFIPCGFFPAFQMIGDKRYDFVVFSRSFEIFDFQNVKLKGLNQVYLEEYFKAWKRMSLNPKLLEL